MADADRLQARAVMAGGELLGIVSIRDLLWASHAEASEHD